VGRRCYGSSWYSHPLYLRSMPNTLPTKEEVFAKLLALKKSGGIDLSTDEDLSLAVMNLVSLEEHFFFTGEKTGKNEYFAFVHDVREMRKKLLARLMPNNEGETWCIAKHLLAATMRLMEVGTKLQRDNQHNRASETFDQAYQLYSMFWAIRLKLIDLSAVKKIADKQLNKHDQKASEQPWTREDLVAKLVDCCDE